jgi:hypothetical protein
MEQSNSCALSTPRLRRHYHEVIADGRVIYSGYDWCEAIGIYFAAARQTGARTMVRQTNGLPVACLHITL